MRQPFLPKETAANSDRNKENDMNTDHPDDAQILDRFDAIQKKDALEWAQKKTMEFAQLMTYYKCAMMEIETKFNVLNEEYSLAFDRNPISSIKSRLKSPLSIKEKLSRKNLPITFESIEENISDVAGIRVVCSFPDDVYALADALLKQDDITLIKKKDYIAHPKANGYRSLHLIVAVPIFLAEEKRLMKVEIQLRTIAMESWASLEHKLRYKKDMDPELLQSISKELSQCAQLSSRLDTRMQTIRYMIDGFDALDEAAIMKQYESEDIEL